MIKETLAGLRRNVWMALYGRRVKRADTARHEIGKRAPFIVHDYLTADEQCDFEHEMIETLARYGNRDAKAYLYACDRGWW